MGDNVRAPTRKMRQVAMGKESVSYANYLSWTVPHMLTTHVRFRHCDANFGIGTRDANLGVCSEETEHRKNQVH